jgi:hypothetical protein
MIVQPLGAIRGSDLTTKISEIPLVRKVAKSMSNGVSPNGNGTSALGKRIVRGASRLPDPAARMIAIIA